MRRALLCIALLGALLIGSVVMHAEDGRAATGVAAVDAASAPTHAATLMPGLHASTLPTLALHTPSPLSQVDFPRTPQHPQLPQVTDRIIPPSSPKPPHPLITPLASAPSHGARATAERDAGCRWRFIKYHPSPFEERWAAGINTYQFSVCASVKDGFAAEWAAYEAVLPRLPLDVAPARSELPSRCAASPKSAPEVFDNRTFSRFEYQLVCNGTADLDASTQFVYIEPLAGMLRHPLICNGQHVRNYTYVLHKQYLLIDEWAMHHNDRFVAESRHSRSKSQRGDHQVRSFYFDLGASTWDAGLGSASQNWFYYTYHQRCIDFDRFLMWEVKGHRPRAIFGQLPGPVKPRYHWYNVPASTKEGSWDNPLTHVLSETNEDDFVMVKIDIDSPAVELALIHQIIRTPALAARIDELYFEHHVNVEIMGKDWWHLPPTYPEYQNASLEMFSALRRIGIRAHSWV
jgi:hypothetical protein